MVRNFVQKWQIICIKCLKNNFKGAKMDLSKIEVGSNPERLNVVIEIPYGSNIKYEIDKDSGAVVVDRVMYSAMFYPANYGFVPNTLSDDGDPADVLVINEYPLQAGSVIKARLIGVLIMEDESGMDEKLIAVPISKIDPRYDRIKSLEDLPQITLDRIKNFFETYKMLEPNKWVKVKEYKDLNTAKEILDKAIKNYK
ncbi:inorganic diphosphatase [Helicobacter winghamensis ATCC BAA-430]|nr:inorganic diphosphatase [Helicobacter winghamensis ATCC BAA-430]